MNIFAKNTLKLQIRKNPAYANKLFQHLPRIRNETTYFSNINFKNRYNYISPVDKPIGSLAINSII
jgi:hypothetical protein